MDCGPIPDLKEFESSSNPWLGKVTQPVREVSVSVDIPHEAWLGQKWEQFKLELVI